MEKKTELLWIKLYQQGTEYFHEPHVFCGSFRITFIDFPIVIISVYRDGISRKQL